MVVVATGLRALVCLFMVSHVDDLFLFPAAFLILVLGKGYGIAKAALVPTGGHRRVRARAPTRACRCCRAWSGWPSAPRPRDSFACSGRRARSILAALTSGTASALATRLAPAVVAPEPADSIEESSSAARHRARAEAMGLLRGIVGFLTFLLAFDLKGGGNDAPVPVGLAIGRAARHVAGFPSVGTGHPTTAPEWHFGAVLVASVAGALLGAGCTATAADVQRGTHPRRRARAGGPRAVSPARCRADCSGRRAARCSWASAPARAARVRRHRATRRARRELRTIVRRVRDALSAVVGDRRVPAGHRPDPGAPGFVVVAGAAGFAAFAYWTAAHPPRTRLHRNLGRVGEVDSREPEAGGVDFGRCRQLAIGEPQAVERFAARRGRRRLR